MAAVAMSITNVSLSVSLSVPLSLRAVGKAKHTGLVP